MSGKTIKEKWIDLKEEFIIFRDSYIQSMNDKKKKKGGERNAKA